MRRQAAVAVAAMVGAEATAVSADRLLAECHQSPWRITRAVAAGKFLDLS